MQLWNHVAGDTESRDPVYRFFDWDGHPRRIWSGSDPLNETCRRYIEQTHGPNFCRADDGILCHFPRIVQQSKIKFLRIQKATASADQRAECTGQDLLFTAAGPGATIESAGPGQPREEIMEEVGEGGPRTRDRRRSQSDISEYTGCRANERHRKHHQEGSVDKIERDHRYLKARPIPRRLIFRLSAYAPGQYSACDLNHTQPGRQKR